MRRLTKTKSARLFPVAGVRCDYCRRYLCWGEIVGGGKPRRERAFLFCGFCDLTYDPIH